MASSEYGRKLTRHDLKHPDFLVVSDPRFIHHMLTENPYNYGMCLRFLWKCNPHYFPVKSPVFRPLVDRLLGHGLVWAEGDEHKQQRKVLNPAFRLYYVVSSENRWRLIKLSALPTFATWHPQYLNRQPNSAHHSSRRYLRVEASWRRM